MSETSPTRRIGVVTTSRADYSHLYWPLRELSAHPEVELAVFVLGAHLSPEFGSTIQEIERDGFPIQARIECLLNSDTDTGMAKTIGLAILGLADALTTWRPDILLLIADRYEMLAPASVALALRIPIAHIEGGEVSQGAIDDHVRNALTKLAAIHFTSTPAARRRVITMGEEPWRVHHAGAPSLDHLTRSKLLDRPTLEARLGIALTSPTILAAWHPATILRDTNTEADAFFAALAAAPGQILCVYPNADAGSHFLIERTRALAATRPNTHIFINLDPVTYWSLLGHVDCIIGNSSSGIMEAASFALPVVNIGIRQQGRERAANVLDAPAETNAILAAIHRALSPDFRASIAGITNPYGNGTAARTITQVLATVPLGNLLIKQPAQLSEDASVADTFLASTSLPLPVEEPPINPATEASALESPTQPQTEAGSEVRSVDPPQSLSPLRISIDPQAMSRSRKGTIFGPICFFIDDQAFPASWYTDLVVAFLSVWFEAIVKILSRKRNHERVRFYHNPYSVDISSAEEGAVDLEFIWHNGSDEKLVASFHAHLRELTLQSMDAAQRTLAVCEERGWSDPDTRMIAATLKDAAAALAKNRGPEPGVPGDRSSSLG
jgi:UDP-N-acetylglucosamine 2-epimerase (non-hydrolysing)/GDP/UDP-N,N'-diacetylbacillosamine 2-epimerase (hydrolysing)